MGSGYFATVSCDRVIETVDPSWPSPAPSTTTSGSVSVGSTLVDSKWYSGGETMVEPRAVLSQTPPPWKATFAPSFS